MWNIFKKRFKIKLTKEIQLWIQDCFLWQIESLPNFSIQKVTTQIPSQFQLDLESVQSVDEKVESVLLELVRIVNIPRTKLTVKIFQSHIESINTDFGEFPLEKDFDTYEVSNCEKVGNKFIIGINVNILDDTSSLTLVLLRELITVKISLLGLKEKLEEQLIDVFSVGLGFGLFNINESFKYSQNDIGWKYSKIGNLSYDELIYCISLYSYLRNEINPKWLSYININYRQKVSKTIQFLFDNELAVLDQKLISTRTMYKT